MNLVIVESPAKAKTIENFLGKDFKVVATVFDNWVMILDITVAFTVSHEVYFLCIDIFGRLIGLEVYIRRFDIEIRRLVLQIGNLDNRFRFSKVGIRN